jgi:putative permease
LRVHYPDFLSEEQLSTLVNTLRAELTLMAQQVLSLSSVLSLFTMLIYLVLMPLLVFFFLQDKILIINWIKQFLPEDIQLVKRVWQEVNLQIGNYVRGKVIEIILVWAATGITLALMGMNYAMLLGFLVGLSVIIPYIGSLVVTVPVVIVGYFQWGLDTHFMYVMALYTIIQVLDGNVLVPLLFSEVVNLHPVAIILAVLIFGGLWGFWGVFFAIPLATLVNAVINAWPGIPEESSEPKVWTG